MASEETYNHFKNTFGRDSFDGNGATMDSIFNRGYSCPNASWNGIFISFCPGFTTDDVTGHEWGHAYTEFTHGLIYQWQSGALNEAYSDMWGETIDQLNGRGLDSPGGARTDGSCTAFITPPPVLRVNAPASIAGNYAVGGADFGPPLTGTGITGDVVLVNDGVGDAGPPTGGGNLSVMDGCETPFVNAAAVAGKIALIYRGTCSFAAKVANAEANGAVAVIISNHALGGNAPFGLGGDGVNFPNIPAVGLGNANGDLLRANLPANATLRLDETPTVDNSYRWLMGEEVTPGGALRDMWNPVCASNPGKVSDVQYTCGASDQGGVHTNSGVPNHAFALLVDGGTYNGQTIAGLGFNKVAPIYFRAQTVYQTPSSNFADHADALEQSCADLIGATLVEAYTGAPTTDVLDADDCQQVAKATLAVELRTEPVQCNFQPLLAKDPPPVCDAGNAAVNLFRESFNEGSARWTTTHNARRPADFTDRDWQVVSNLPDGRDGSAMFAVDPTGGTCAPGGDESAVLHLSSKAIKIPNGVAEPLLTFDHWVATEANFDGGNLKVSVNGGDWQLVPAASFTYNPYNLNLATAAQGNTNPLAGEPAFSGTDPGSVSGSWGTSRVNLTGLAAAGDSVRLRFDFGNDGCGGAFGWYVTDIRAYGCASTTAPSVAVDDVSVEEGDRNIRKARFTVSLAHTFNRNVVVQYQTADGTARVANNDYAAKSGSVVIPAGSISAQVVTDVVGDRIPEADERFNLKLTHTSQGTILDNRGICTIVNDDN